MAGAPFHSVIFPLGAALGMVLCPACASTSALQTATPVPRGEVRLGVEAGAALIASLPHLSCWPGAENPPGQCHAWYRAPLALGTPYPGLGANDNPALPALAFSARYGAFERADLGVRVTAASLDLDAKLLLLRTERWRLAFAPTAGVRYPLTQTGNSLSPAMGVTVRLALFGGLVTRLGEAVLSFGPSSTHMFGQFASDALALGGSVGFAFRVNERVQLMPQLTLDVPVAGLPPQPANLDQHPALLQVLFGVLWRAD
jgi:hypothetical protein